MFILQFIRGMLMAVADSVPGVSGGTIAFVMGFYDKFISSLHDIVSKDKDKRNNAIIFLLKIGSGWIVGMVLSILFISSVFEAEIYRISSLFIGLIIGAIPFIVLQEKETLKDKYHYLVYTLIGVLIVFSITYFNPIINGGEGLVSDAESINLWIGLFIIFAGMLAISAMVLPGISGSTILLIFGLYAPVISSIRKLIGFDFSGLLIVVLLGIGILSGVALTIKLVKKAIDHYRPQTIYTILGLMVGSLYAVVMGPLTLEVPKEHLSISTFSIVFFIIGAFIIVGLEQLRKYFESKK